MKNPIAVSSSKPECARQDAPVPSNKRKAETADANTQTEASQRIVTTKRTKRFRQNEMDIEEVEEERFVLFDIIKSKCSMKDFFLIGQHEQLVCLTFGVLILQFCMNK